MKRAIFGWLFLAPLALATPLGAVPQPQVLDDFKTGVDGRPLGWEVIGLGAEATLTHDGAAPGAMKVDYTFTQPTGRIYLLTRLRLRAKPWAFEMTVKGDGGNQVFGALVRELLTGKIYEFGAEAAAAEAGWSTRWIKPKMPAGADFQTLDSGGGLRLEGLVIRKGPGAPDKGTLEIRDIVAQCDVEDKQAAMIDVLVNRLDGVHLESEKPSPEILVNRLKGEAYDLQVTYEVTDAENKSVGRGSTKVSAGMGLAGRVPVTFTPRGTTGFYTVKASVKDSLSERHATARFCVVPAVPPGPGRHIGVDVSAHRDPGEPWYDPIVFTLLQRAGAGAARVDLRWSEIEPTRGRRNWDTLDHFIELSKRTGLPLHLVAADPPGWIRREAPERITSAFVTLVQEAAKRGGAQIASWEIWREPNTVRQWPPQPQPYAYKTLVEAVAKPLKQTSPAVPVASGGLRGFEPGFAGTLLLAEPFTIDQLGFTIPRSRHAFPFLPTEQRPSEEATELLTAARDWMSATARSYVPPLLVEVGVRTSPVEASKLGQAIELARVASLARAFGGEVYWHNAVDGDDSADRYGLIRRNLEPKPAILALAVNAARLHGARYTGTANSGGPIHLFTGGGGFVGVAVPARMTTYRTSGDIKAVDMWGNPISGSPRSDNGPIYFSGPGLAKLLASR